MSGAGYGHITPDPQGKLVKGKAQPTSKILAGSWQDPT